VESAGGIDLSTLWLFKETIMAKRLTILAVLLMIPGGLLAASTAPAVPTPEAPVAVSQPAVTPQAGIGPVLDFATWLQNQEKPVAASSCGPNFCTQAERTKCAQTCHHVPFVGLQCCSDCTTICNCGSVPIEC
jgi:hypothetical protein